nr:hypothetical protein [Prevotella sp. UBA4952]
MIPDFGIAAYVHPWCIGMASMVHWGGLYGALGWSLWCIGMISMVHWDSLNGVSLSAWDILNPRKSGVDG